MSIQVKAGFFELTEMDSGESVYVRIDRLVALRAYKEGSMVWFDAEGPHMFIVKENINQILEAVNRAQLNLPNIEEYRGSETGGNK